MSFSNDVKNELARIVTDDVNMEKAELLGLLRMSGAIVIRNHNVGIYFTTENAALARRVLQLLKNNYRVETEVVITRLRRLKKNNRYQIQVLPSSQVNKAMEELKLLSVDGDLANKLLTKSEPKRAYLRGCFLGGGSISRPASDYHLEMVSANRSFCLDIIKVMESFAIRGKLAERKGGYLVYLKEGDGISNFLSVIGAHSAMMELENMRIVKEMRNNVNRAVNCETANLNKVVRAAMWQISCIRYIDTHLGLGKLKPGLQETARLRLEYPHVALSDLVEFSGGIGKSGLNHRLRRLQEIAISLGMDKEEASGC